ncbi:MAG TPA: hypothetical protein VGD71_08215 [Kribbella sp.]
MPVRRANTGVGAHVDGGSVGDLEYLNAEFNLEPGTFLFKLHVDGEWDTAAFTRLDRAMTQVCADLAGHQQLPRWLVAGFWYTCDFTTRTISDSDLPRNEPAPYYERAGRRLRDLNAWLDYGWPI